MRIASCDLWRFHIPFRMPFVHAAAARAQSDAIIVEVRTESGVTGFGEIQARTYVTGESNDSIWNERAHGIGSLLLGRELHSIDDCVRAVGGVDLRNTEPALFGGFEMALIDALELEHGLDWASLFGPVRRSATKKCMTIGQDSSGSALVKQGQFARLTGCDVVKLKVAGAEDAERCQTLRDAVGENMALRLDANGQLSLDSANELLAACVPISLDSLEEPFNKLEPRLIEDLRALHGASAVPLVADESVCTLADIDRFAAAGVYQVVNVRVGKSGGVTGTARMLDRVLASRFGIVCGTMVGESAVMLRISKKMLEHCEALTYVEGIDQATMLLEAQVIEPVEARSDQHFSWRKNNVEKYLVGHQKCQLNP